jgi:hypothetical protein
MSKLTFQTKMLPLVLVIPLAWIISQLIWIYSDHKPDYSVLPMDNWFSLALSIGTFVFMVITFYIMKWVTNKKAGTAKFGAQGICQGGDHPAGPGGADYFSEEGVEATMGSSREQGVSF